MEHYLFPDRTYPMPMNFSPFRAWNILLFTALLSVSIALPAQQTAIYEHEQELYRDGMELFDKEKYAAALKSFETFVLTAEDPRSEQVINAAYHAGICALYLFHKDAEYRLEKFVQDYPESPWVRKVYFELATYNYQRKRYKKSLEWFEFVNPNDLPADRVTEFYFKRGHARFEQGEFDEARSDFFQIKDKESRFQAPAIYYYSHIAYSNEDWQTAQDGFKQLQADENFAPVVPYYLTQILYKQKKYDELLSYAPALLDSSSQIIPKRKPEISRLIGDAYYRKAQYAEALPYLIYFHEETPKKDRSPEDFFQLGYTYYALGDPMSALDALTNASKEDNELAQSAIYYMADCYLKMDQKNYAKTAFRKASEMDYNLQIKEDALFNYAKLAFELSYNPFDDAITAFESYLEEYPNSPRKDEAYEFLLTVYMKSRNYEKALASLDQIENKDTRTKEAYQVVAFNRGVELFQTNNLDEAEAFFNKVNTYPVNNMLTAEAMFWKAEIAFKQKAYTKAVGLYNSFVQEPGAYNSPYFLDGHYGAGYALFKQKKYISAATSFRKYVDQNKGDDDKKLNDALMRIGDCYYVSKDYDKAITYYDQAIAMGQPMKDYAIYQKAVCYGLKGQNDKKIWVLKQLIEEEPDSKYTVDAKFQLAKTYLEQDQWNEAKVYYNDILTQHPNSQYVKYSLVDLCLVYVKNGNNDAVVDLWNRIKTDYPNDQIVVDAYNLVESILIEEGILNDLPPVLDLTDSEIEEKVFTAAADFAITGQCNKAIPKLEDYLMKYAPSRFATAANYYLGNCYFEDGQTSKALNAYNYVVSQPVSDYTEESLVAAATINYNNQNYSQALNHYIELENVAILKNNELEAQIGQMRCHYFLGDLGYAEEYANKVIANSSTPDDIKNTAFLWRGRIRMLDEQWDEAYYDFVEVEKKGGEKGAEAKYNMALIAYKKEAYKASETEIFKLIEKYAAFNEWKYSGFLLLADVYIGLEDYFQARATLNTIKENVSEPWVIDATQQKLEELDALENPPAPEQRSNEIEIDLGENEIPNQPENEENNE